MYRTEQTNLFRVKIQILKLSGSRILTGINTGWDHLVSHYLNYLNIWQVFSNTTIPPPLLLASVIIRQLQGSIYNISLCCLPPLLSLQFHLLTNDQYWYRPPHDRAQFQYDEIHVKSLLLKLDPSIYMSYDNFYSVMQGNHENWG